MLGHYLPFSIKLKFLSELIAQQPVQFYRQNFGSDSILSQTKAFNLKILDAKNLHYGRDTDFWTWLNGKRN